MREKQRRLYIGLYQSLTDFPHGVLEVQQMIKKMAGRYPVHAAYGVFLLLFACQRVVFYGAKAFSFSDYPDS